ncbi:MAG: 4-hydroxy-2-oxoheptanedioate aldolase [Deltaproteobacteria bacterium]|nr:4-hydroxy-2-oxoheptanedioate aldolase [Deltaproteobacteria bacterium]
MLACPNKFKEALKEKKQQIGLWQSLGSFYTAEICAGSGFDWLLIDAEHGPNDLLTVLHQLQAVAPYPVHPVVRPVIGSDHQIKRYLDIGAQTLLIPMVEDGRQAREIARAVQYPPKGIRGVGAAVARASRWNRVPGYLKKAGESICLLLQVESVEALKNLEDITSTPGVDGIFIGPSDLSASMGYLGDAGHPDVVSAVKKAIRVIAAKGKAPGLLSGDEKLAREYMEAGSLFTAVGTDVGILARGAEALAKKFA